MVPFVDLVDPEILVAAADPSVLDWVHENVLQSLVVVASGLADWNIGNSEPPPAAETDL